MHRENVHDVSQLPSTLLLGRFCLTCSGLPPLPELGILTPEENKDHEKTLLASLSLFVQLLLSVLTELIPTVIVNFMCQFGWSGAPRYLVKHDSGCVCGGVSGWDMVNWVKQMDLPYVGGLHPICRGSEQNKRGNFSIYLTAELWRQSFPVLRLKLTPSDSV